MDADTIARVAERKIQEAIDEGKFDNLPGKGKPIVFDDDPMTPPELRMANKVLKNAGVLPDWMQVRKEILAEKQGLDNLRARLIREHGTQRVRLASLPIGHSQLAQFAEWHARSRQNYERRLKSFNTAVLKFSIMAPSTASPFRPLRIEEEMAAFDRDFPTLRLMPPPSVSTAPENDSNLRRLARARYQEGEGGGPVRGWAKVARAVGLHRETEQTSGFEAEDIGRADAPNEAPHG